MRKKLGTRFPAPRIKKIMQADEDIGKIALPVPLLVSKALELFLQDLCDRAYEVTLQRGAKTLNSLHLKQCVKMYNAFDFLSDIVNKVPNLGGAESAVAVDDKGIISRRRKTLAHDGDAPSDDSRSAKVAMSNMNASPRGGRGRGRGRGRPPLNRTIEKESSYIKFDEEIDMSPEHGDLPAAEVAEAAKENLGQSADPPNQQPTTNVTAASSADMKLTNGARPTEYSTWPLSDAVSGNLGMVPSNIVNLSMHIDEDEDYDNED